MAPVAGVRTRQIYIFIEIATEYMHMMLANGAAGSDEGSAAISSQILNAERAGERGGRGDPEGGQREALTICIH